MPYKVCQVDKHDDLDQDSVTLYPLGTQESIWPQVCRAQSLKSYEEEDEIPESSDIWEPNQSTGVSDAFMHLRSRCRAVLADYTSVANVLWQKIQILAGERQIQQVSKYQTAIDLLRAWRMGDEKEQRETLEYLKHALDEDRLSDRKLFP